MKKNLLVRCIVLSFIAILTLLNAPVLKAQIDVLDLYRGAAIEGCLTTPDISINVNIDGCNPDTTVIIKNISGYRSFVDNPPDHYNQYKFCAATVGLCGSSGSPGQFSISFQSGGLDIGVKKLSFILCSHSSAVITGVQFYNVSGSLSSTQTSESCGTKYACEDNTTGITSVVITCSYDGSVDESSLFELNSLLMPSPCSLPAAPVASAGTAAACAQISANWAASAYATGYYLDVSTVNTFASFVAGYNNRDVSNVTIYNVTGLTAGTTYYYRVRAYNTCGCGISLNSGTITYATLPATPTISASGPLTFCSGGSVTLTSSAGTSYLWSTGETTQSIIVTTSGNYTVRVTIAGCQSASSSPTAVTVNPIPATPTISASGPLTFCSGGSVTLTSSAGTSYLWSTGETTQSIIVTTSGNYTVRVTIAGCQSASSSPTAVTVNPAPAAITGTTTICVGSNTTLGDATPGGTWSSATPTVATINSSGVVTGVSAGTSVISYTLPTGCAVTTTVTVNPKPAAIAGTKTVCVGSTTTLSDATPGGIWSSATPTVATINSSGVVTGVSAGTSVISYTLPTGCAITTTVTVNPVSVGGSVTGGTTICAGSTSGLLTLAGHTGSVIRWQSSLNGSAWTNIANTATTYTSNALAVTTRFRAVVKSGVCPTANSVATIVTVNPLPAAITGIKTVSLGSTTTLSDATSGGTWSSATPTVATINSSGVVTGISAGTSEISYTLPTGCAVTTTVTVNLLPAPAGVISATVCQGQNGAMYNVAEVVNATSYIWSYTGTGATILGNTNPVTINFATNATSGNLTVFGVNAYGSGTVSPNYAIMVNPLPGTAGTITGTDTVCQGQSGVSYWIPVIANASSYLWSYSGSGATITGTTNNVTIDFSETATSGNLMVRGINACGNGLSSANYAIIVNPLQGAARTIKGTTDIDDVDPFAGLNIYPNPTPGLFTIEIDNQLFGELNITVLDQSGKKILDKKFEKTTEHFSSQIDLSGQAKGMYVINMILDKYLATRKIVLE